MSYYYFAASLPELNLEAEPPMDIEQFAGECELHLSQNDYSTLMLLMADDPEVQDMAKGPFAAIWLARQRQILLTLTRRRAARWSTPVPEMNAEFAEFSADIERGTEEAAQNTDPFEREKALDAMLWRELDELEIREPFSNMAVFAYGLKLKMVQRRTAMTDSGGRETLDKLLETTPQDDKKKA